MSFYNGVNEMTSILEVNVTVRVSNSPTYVLNLPDAQTRSEHCLSAEQTVRLDDFQKGSVLVCTKGVLWITQEGDPQDYLLQLGEIFVLEYPGLVLVQALKHAACWRCLD